METVFDHGASGDGTTDDTAAFQAAADAGHVFAPSHTPTGEPATYIITSTINLSGGAVRIDGTVDATTMPAGATFDQAVVFKCEGAISAGPNIDSRISAGQTTFSIENTYQVGDLLLLENDERPIPGIERADRDKGEIKRVIETDGASFRTSSPTYFDYNPPSKISLIQPVKINFSGTGTIICGGVGSGHSAIFIKFGIRPTISGLTILNAEDVGASLQFCWSPVVSNIQVEGSTSPSYGSTGYGIYLGGGTTAAVVTQCMFFNCRHGLAGNGRIPSLFCSVDRCFSDNALLDSHEPCFEWQFFGNVIMGGNDGMLIRGQHTDAIFNRFFGNSGTALRVKTWDLVTVQEGIRTVFNRIRASGSGYSADGRSTSSDPVSRKPGLVAFGDRVEQSGNANGASVTITHATEATVNVETRRNHGVKGVDILSSRLRELIALADDALVPVSLSDSTVKRDK